MYAWVKPPPDKLPWAEPHRLATYDALLGNTLYGQEYLSITLDEAQGYRNSGAKHSAAIGVLKKGKVRMIMSATPLQTSTKVNSVCNHA